MSKLFKLARQTAEKALEVVESKVKDQTLYLDHLCKKNKLDRITVSNPSGCVIATSDGQGINLDISDRQYFIHAKSGEGMQTLVLSRVNDKHYLVTSAPVYNEKKEIVATIQLFRQS